MHLLWRHVQESALSPGSQKLVVQKTNFFQLHQAFHEVSPNLLFSILETVTMVMRESASGSLTSITSPTAFLQSKKGSHHLSEVLNMVGLECPAQYVSDSAVIVRRNSM